MDAIYQYYIDQIENITKSEFAEMVRSFNSNLKFPLTIYRGLRFEDWDDGDSLESLAQKISFSDVGLFWTYDHSAAVAGGVIAGGDFNSGKPHVVLEARINQHQCDMLSTLFQNLTVYEEEKEIRLLPDMDITITGISPVLDIDLPLIANTGSEKYDKRETILAGLVKNAARAKKRDHK